jgi:Tfp pilus assembly protein FimT
MEKQCYSALLSSGKRIAAFALEMDKDREHNNRMVISGFRNRFKPSPFRAQALRRRAAGFSVVELLIVLLVVSILVVLALPQLMSSQHLFKFASIQRDTASLLREVRQQAMSQRTAITFRYDDGAKTFIVYGGAYGPLADPKNQIFALGDAGDAANITYGRPTGVPVSALGDGTNLEALTGGMVDITFQPDGSVVDGSNNPLNKAMFFYHSEIPSDSAFAVSILGAGGRVKTWRYSYGANAYVE